MCEINFADMKNIAHVVHLDYWNEWLCSMLFYAMLWTPFSWAIEQIERYQMDCIEVFLNSSETK